MYKTKLILIKLLTLLLLAISAIGCIKNDLTKNFHSELKLTKNYNKYLKVMANRDNGISDPFEIVYVRHNNEFLEIDVSYSGTGEKHSFELVIPTIETNKNSNTTGIALLHYANMDTDSEKRIETLFFKTNEIFENNSLYINDIQLSNISNNQDVGVGYDEDGNFFNNKVSFLTDISRVNSIVGGNSSGDSFVIEKAEINSDKKLAIALSYTGGCADHEWEVLWDGFTGANGEITLVLVHNANNDPCEAYFTEKAFWNIQQLVGDPTRLQITLINASNLDEYKFQN